ncbi:MAG: acetoacetate decarboxylase family protein, partial [Anaerolineae bacterium]
MQASGFFDGVPQVQYSWRDTLVNSPVFYQDARMLIAAFLAPHEKVNHLLPTKRLVPLRVTPWHTLVFIAAYEYRASDIGPYNEVGISVPVTLERPSPVFTGLLWPLPAELNTYLLHLPVTSEIACALGVETAAYPKFLADIIITEEGDRVSCRLSEAGQHILTLTVRKGQPKPVPRSRMYSLNARGSRLLRTCSISERD